MFQFIFLNFYYLLFTTGPLNKKDQFNGKILFVANSMVDPFDPNEEVHQALLNFSQKIETALGDRIFFKYVTYDHYGHVPFPGFYDGMNYILEIEKQ